jgi:hypothetical protein
MKYSPITFSRRHVLGDLYSRCEPVESVPLYIDGPEPELVGHVDESMGRYADAFCFHLSDDYCKKLSAGHFTYSFDCDYVDPSLTGSFSRVRLNSITLVARKGYERPKAKNAAAAEKAAAEAEPAEIGVE